MTEDLNGNRVRPTAAGKARAALRCGAALGLGLMLCVMTSCETPDASVPTQQNGQLEPQTVSAGDVLKIAFPGTPNLNSTQTVRPDGRITLDLVGEVVAAGMTPLDLEKDLIQRYSSQLVSKEVTVTVVSSSFQVFVTGAVIKPGKILSDHPITALEAVMEAGGFDNTKADTKAVVVIRKEGAGTKNYTLNLQLVLEGKSGESFYLRRSDIIFVPERFSWF